MTDRSAGRGQDGAAGAVSPEAEELCRRAMAYFAGMGAPQDKVRAALLFEQAAGLGHPVAANHLGAMLQYGDGVSEDPARAAQLYQEAADAGLAVAQFNLGFLYHHGIGVPIDLPLARSWYERAGRHGEPTALSNLGILLARGEGGPKDPIRAQALWALAAEWGEANAAFNLGIALAGGHDVEVDFGEAYYWFTISGRLGHPAAQAQLDKIRPVMTDAEWNHARQRLSEASARD